MNYQEKMLRPFIILGISLLIIVLVPPLSFPVNWWVVFVGWILVSGLGVAVGMHRVFSHNTYNLQPWFEAFVVVCATLAGQGSTVTWRAVHLGYHHRYSDTEQDPHSPIHGKWSAFLGWYCTLDESKLSMRAALPLLNVKRRGWIAKFHRWVHQHYENCFWYGWFIVIFLVGSFLFLTGSPWSEALLTSLFSCYLVMLISLLQDNGTNLLAHYPINLQTWVWLNKRKWTRFIVNKRYMDGADQSLNSPLLGLVTWGQMLHNNHHTFPGRFNFALEWYEFDPCVIWRPLLRFVSRNKDNR